LLQQRGFHTTTELDDSHQHGGISNLAAELDVPFNQAHCLMEEVLGCISQPLPSILTAKDLWNSSRLKNHKIVTFSQSMDKLLGGGIDIGQVTELAGMPGVGKTQLAMQLCVNARLPKLFGGVEGQAVYIDAEGSLSPERLFGMAKALVGHVEATSRRRNHLPFPPSNNNNFTPEHILDAIHVFRVHDEAAQTATLYSLPHFLEQQQQDHPQQLPVKLIVIDSIAFHYRSITPTNQNYYIQRTKALTQLAAFLGDLATNYELAVVVINQMTTKIDSNNNSSRCVPALGESWAHATTTRLLLSNNNNNNSNNNASDHRQQRTCTLVKSPNKPAGTANYQVLDIGIRDVVHNKPRAVPHAGEGEEEDDQNKRLRTH
jgi:RAD51-like protein 2